MHDQVRTRLPCILYDVVCIHLLASDTHNTTRGQETINCKIGQLHDVVTSGLQGLHRGQFRIGE
jgi:hypothetical protein